MSFMVKAIPLATQLRAATLEQYVGQRHLVEKDKPLYQAYQSRIVYSMIFWGPPGVGKTTLACLLSQQAKAELSHLSAVTAGVSQIRDIAKKATETDLPCVLFLDEIHRFNKAQQDALLPHVESGLLTLIGATTENPSFSLNNALLSRCQVYTLKSLTFDELNQLIDRVLSEAAGFKNVTIDLNCRKQLIDCADGDGRRLLNLFDVMRLLLEEGESKVVKITQSMIDQVLADFPRRFDQQGDLFYDQISALHKSIRGSDPDASLYWFCRMLDGGVDARYLARRLIRIASEDIGNADPQALQLTNDAAIAYERLGSPEGELALAQAVLYLASCVKSNAVYKAFNQAMDFVKKRGSDVVPNHLKNAPTQLMKQQGAAVGYRYPHDEPHGFSKGVNYFPEGVAPQNFYQPVARGIEKKIIQKLALLKTWNKNE